MRAATKAQRDEIDRQIAPHKIVALGGEDLQKAFQEWNIAKQQLNSQRSFITCYKYGYAEYLSLKIRIFPLCCNILMLIFYTIRHYASCS